MAPVTLGESVDLMHAVRDSLSASSLEVSRTLDEGGLLLPQPLPARALAVRQAQITQPIIVPATYVGIDPGANGGEIAGIVLGTVFGVILLIWLANSLINSNQPNQQSSAETNELGRYSAEEGGNGKTARSSRKSRTTTKTRSSRRRSRSRSVISRSEMSERSPARAPPRSPRRARETVIIEESRREPSRVREVEEDDIIEVIEEHSPVRRPRRMSGYRNVDPDEYGGGSRPMRRVKR